MLLALDLEFSDPLPPLACIVFSACLWRKTAAPLRRMSATERKMREKEERAADDWHLNDSLRRPDVRIREK